MDSLISPTRHRLGSMRTDMDVLPLSNGVGVGVAGRGRGKIGGWSLADDRPASRSSWLARFTPSASDHNVWKSSSTSSSSWSLSSLWQNFHLFEAPRRRTLTSSNSSDPSSSMLKFCLLCSLWYSSSAMSSNTGKAILNQFKYPVTLTYVQFAFVAAFCLLFSSPLIRFTRLRRPTRAILQSTFPMGLFQVGGHMFSSMAISRIPVSTVHTIKALSPLFTVAAYALLFGVKYSPKTYISLLPLTVGVIFACSSDMSASNSLGLLCAFGSAVVFVSSNIFFKKVMPSTTKGGTPQTSTQKLDKLNLLFYSSSMAFLVMTPIWILSDLPVLMSSSSEHVVHPKQGHSSQHGVLYYFILNGTVNFSQNIIAFVILASTSPVTYSIASLFKRVAVICIAIVWFNQSVHSVQAMGICLTFFGLWMYNNAKADVEKGEKKMRRVEAAREMLLPSTKAEHRMMHEFTSPALSENEDNVDDVPLSQTSALARHVFVPSPTALTNGFVPPLADGKANAPPSNIPPRSHHYPNPNLHIEIAPPPSKLPSGVSVTQFNAVRRATQSPTDSYPSPPLSHDSPPPSALPTFTSSSPPNPVSTTSPAVASGKTRIGRRATFSSHVGYGSGGGGGVPTPASPSIPALA